LAKLATQSGVNCKDFLLVTNIWGKPLELTEKAVIPKYFSSPLYAKRGMLKYLFSSCRHINKHVQSIKSLATEREFFGVLFRLPASNRSIT
jgi:hypothetical protein